MIAFDAGVGQQGVNPGTSVTWSHTCSGNDRILFVVTRGGGNEGDRVTGITYAGVAMTKSTGLSVNVSGGTVYLSLYYLINPSRGTNNVVVSLSSGYMGCGSASYNGVYQGSFPDASTTNQATTTNLTTSLTPVKDKCWIILAAVGIDNNISAGAGSFQRVLIEATHSTLYDTNGVVTPPASTSMTVNAAGSIGIGAIMASFAPAIPGGSFLFNLI